jgi:ubiquinone/menaquinone biosynthesis C-methylase UbiE
MIYNFKILFVITLIILILFLIFSYHKIRSIENFEDKFDDHEKYDEIYDEEFINLYEIIYRDFSDIDYDTKIVYSKVVENIKNKENINFLVCGSGIGKLCKKIKEKYNVVGVDISENMLKKAQTLYPNIKFIRGNIIKNNIFNKNQFSHIYIDERTLYYNKPENIDTIIKNSFNWLVENGFLIVQIYDPLELQVAARYYSSQYIDNKGNFHGFTYLNDFSHDCYYIKDENDDNKEIFHYFDKIVFDNGSKRIKKTTFYIPSKEKVYDIIINNGFDVFYIEKVRTQIVGGYELAIFRKKKQIVSVDELEKKNIKK